MAELLQFPNSAPQQQDDSAARSTALDITLSAIVEAPAGSGKTALLINRYLKLLASPSVTQPEEVLAITFTNKAAAELRERVLAQLQAAHHNLPLKDAFDRQNRDLALAVLARDAQLHWDLLIRPQRLNLRTIDSVCTEIANSLPILSAGGAPRQPTEDASPLYRQAAQRTLFQLGGTNPQLHDALYKVLRHRDANLNDVERLLAGMLAAREQWGELIPLNPAELTDDALDNIVRPRLERTLEAIVCAGLSRVLELFGESALHQATQLAAHIGSLPAWKDKQPLLSICADKRIPPSDIADHLDHWLALAHLLTTRDGGWRSGIDRGNLTHDFDLKRDKPRIVQLIADLKSTPHSEALLDALCALRTLPPTRYPEDQWQVAKSLFHVLRHSLIELQLLFAESGKCDFTELALAARQALHNDPSAPDIALAFGLKLRHLLVDEMQDTSSGQYELIHLLTQSWDGHNQTLFLVGDPKQSIYLFRQARVERFLRTMHDQRLGEIRLTPLRLTANFRSQATLVHAFNRTFAHIFPTPDAAQPSTPTDVPFVAANPTRPPSSLTDGLHWQPVLLDPQNPPRIPHPLQQARNIRSVIQHWLTTPLPEGRRATPDRPEKPWSIAVLARARNHLAPIVAELKQHRISFRAVNIDSLAELPEVLDALALTRALLHPADRVAWLAVLHAPWCGLSLADLLTLTGEGPAADPSATLASLVESRSPLLSATGRQLLARSWPILRQSLATLGRTPLHIHVERTWRSLGGDAPLSSTQRLNVLRFVEVLAALEAETGRINFDILNARLRALYAEPGPQCSVELLTMHKAKGLEWDIVLVPSLERKGGSSTADLLTWLELDGSASNAPSILLAPIVSRGADSAKLNDWIRSIREARENAERKRLFYVACTRAKEELHLFAAVKLDAHGELSSPIHGSLLKSVWPAAEPTFVEAAHARAAQPSTSPLDHHLTQSISLDDLAAEPAFNPTNNTIALSAAASNNLDSPSIDAPSIDAPPPILHRLPLSFHPLDRFTNPSRLNYLHAAALPHAPAFERPEGSFAVRAFGNVVHRYLQLLAERLASTTPDHLLAELPTWQPRLIASLRGEGLAPAHAGKEAERALRALTTALQDPIGRWILAPHPEAASEQSLTLSSPETSAILNLRADRTFLAAAHPLSLGSSHIWIVDFKTGELNNRPLAAFRSAELARYQPQLETYAQVRRTLPNGHLPIRLGLFYPLIPILLDWSSTAPELA
jgi:ATP-dependent helicase/nuclease subunit A